MTGEHEHTPAAQQDEGALIESIYTIALEPHSYDDFMERWDEHISNATSELKDLEKQSREAQLLQDSAVSTHFDIGFRLLEEMGRKSPATFFASSDEDRHQPRLLLNDRGRVVWYNGAAAQQLDLRRHASLDMLPLTPEGLHALQPMIEALSNADEGGELGGQIVVTLQPESDSRPVYMVAKPTQDRSGGLLLLLEPAMPGWPSAMHRLLTDGFRLSAAEIAIAEAISNGESVTEIAGHRSSSVETVRTQLKKVMAKTGARSQAELVRLLYSLIRVAETESPPTPQDSAKVQRTSYAIAGRKMPVEIYGDPAGYPLLFLHGMLDSARIVTDMDGLLRSKGLRMIAPARPWFGDADGDEGPVSQAPRRLAGDLADLLAQMNVSETVLVGHLAGSLYAFAAAERMPHLVRGIVNVAGGVPIVSSQQIASMSRRQRLVAYTARYTPAILPFVLRAGIRQLDFGGEDSFMRALYETSPRDLAALENEEIYDIVRAGYHFAVAQGHRAFETDSYQMVRDWSYIVSGSSVPVTLIHGCGDPVVSIDSVRDFAGRLSDRAKLIELPDVGQLVFYVRPDIVIDAVCEYLGNERNAP